MRGPHEVYDARKEQGRPWPHLIIRCGNPRCPVGGGAMLMRLMPDGLARVSAVVICWKCSANNIVTIDESEFGRDEPAERIAVELPLAESAPAEPCFFCGNGLADTPTYSLEGRAGRLTICRRCAEQMALTDIPH